VLRGRPPRHDLFPLPLLPGPDLVLPHLALGGLERGLVVPEPGRIAPGDHEVLDVQSVSACFALGFEPVP
jgi:hypothetical protein